LVGIVGDHSAPSSHAPLATTGARWRSLLDPGHTAVTRPRDSSYVWVTWLPRLLAGQSHCEWAAWFRAHHSDYEKGTRNFDFAAHNAQHAEMVRDRAQELRREGCFVTIEDQNSFAVRGHTGSVLGGKPDILATSNTSAL